MTSWSWFENKLESVGVGSGTYTHTPSFAWYFVSLRVSFITALANHEIFQAELLSCCHYQPLAGRQSLSWEPAENSEIPDTGIGSPPHIWEEIGGVWGASAELTSLLWWLIWENCLPQSSGSSRTWRPVSIKYSLTSLSSSVCFFVPSGIK